MPPEPRDPIAGETINGFIARITSANGIARANSVAEYAGVKFPHNWYAHDDIRRLCAVADVDFDAVIRNVASAPREFAGDYVSAVFGQDIPTRFFVRNGRRICPVCLRGSPHHRFIWDLRFVGGCVDHDVRLLASCPACEKKLGWRIPAATHCGCGYDLRDATSEKAVPGSLEATRFLQSVAMGATADAPPLMTALTLSQAYDLLAFVASVLLGFKKTWLTDSVTGGFDLLLSHALRVASGTKEELKASLVMAVEKRRRRKHTILAEIEKLQVTMADAEPVRTLLEGVAAEMAQI